MRERKEFNLPDGDWFLYVLKCQHSYHYIGVSTALERRLRQHNNGKGASVTRLHKPTKLVAVYSIGNMSYQEAEMYEDAFTLKMVAKHNSTRWRGGRYCTKILPKTAKKKLEKMDAKYLADLSRVEFSFSFCHEDKRGRKRRQKKDPWTKQARKARDQLRVSAHNRFGIRI